MSAGRIRIQVAESLGELDIAQWQRVATAAGAPVHYTPAYLRAYQDSPLSPYAAVRYLTAVEAGRTVAILPCYLDKRGDPYGFLREVGIAKADGPALLGHNWYCYDTRVPVLATDAGHRDRVLAAMLDGLAEVGAGAQVAGLVSVPEGDPLLDVARGKGWRVAPIVTRFQLPLQGVQSYDDYLARLGPRTRRTIRRYARRAADVGATMSVESPRPDFLRTVCDLTRRTAAKHGSADMYPESAFVDFVMALGDRARVVRVDVPGRTLAAAVVLLDDQRLHMWVGGTSDATVHSFSPNYLLWATEIRAAIESGKEWVEGGRSNRPMKERHGMRPLPLYACVTPG
ncbi:GNAT family N-acetyltransferase [Streptomyces sp. AC154]|uniref:GNAT family N-acetyltransferase n=1 Tax=Streptomyces sp. AC154 TaxID=3143184 RepID=UPI003F7E51A0